MAVIIRTTKEIVDDIIADINTKFGITVPLFGKVFLLAWAAVLGAQLRLYYLTIGSVQKNMAPDTADTEANGGTLERFGRIQLDRNPFPATNAVYSVIVDGTPASVIKTGTTFKSDDASLNPGKLYILDAEFVLSATPPDTMQLRSLETGSVVSLSNGDTLTATSPIAGVNKQVVVSNEDTQPIDAESEDLYRARIVEAEQLEPQGGAGSDYRIWAADAPGVRRIYPFANPAQCSGVIIHVEANIEDSIDDAGTPSAQIIDDVRSVINFDPDVTKPLEERGRRPLQVLDVYEPIVLNPVRVEITNFQGGLTLEIRAAVNEAITNLLFDIRPFVDTADIPENKNDTLSVNDLIVTINSAIPSTTFFDTLELQVNGNVIVSNFLFTDGNIPNLESITYV